MGGRGERVDEESVDILSQDTPPVALKFAFMFQLLIQGMKVFCMGFMGLLTFHGVQAQGAPEGEVSFSPRHAVKMTEAKHDFNIGNLRGALTSFREILDEVPASPKVELWIARCHLALRREDLAIAYLDSLKIHDEEVANSALKLRGEVLHRLGRYEEAIDVLEIYLDFGKPADVDFEEVSHWIAECRRAWNASEKGVAVDVDVTFEHMGGAINSRFDEYAPAWSPDGSSLIFTSRRDAGLNPEIDTEGDHQFYSDIYRSERSSEPGGWSRAQLLEGEINTMGFDAVLSWPATDDGRSVLVYRNNNQLAGDICVSTQMDDQTWSDAMPMSRPINSSYFEGSASISADGELLYFISERPEGMGRGDIYRSQRRGSSWSVPQPLGAPVNTVEDEKFVHAQGDGRVIYFASRGHAGFGDYDMYRTEWVEGGWSVPVNLGLPINSPREESTFALDATGNRLVMTAERSEGYGARDLYMLDVSRHPWFGKRATEIWAGVLTVVLDLEALPKTKPDKCSVQVWDEGARTLLHEVWVSRQSQAELRLPSNSSFVIRAVTQGHILAENIFERQQDVPGAFASLMSLKCLGPAD